MKNILLNSCYPPPLSAAKEAPSSVSSLSQLVPRHILQRTESRRRAPVPPVSTVPEPAPSRRWPRSCRSAAAARAAPPVPSWCSSEPRACRSPAPLAPPSRLFQEVEVHSCRPLQERGGRAHTAILGCSASEHSLRAGLQVPTPPARRENPRAHPNPTGRPPGLDLGGWVPRYPTMLPFRGSQHFFPQAHPPSKAKGDSEESLVPSRLPENSAPMTSSNSHPRHCDEHDRNSPKALLHPHKEQ